MTPLHYRKVLATVVSNACGVGLTFYVLFALETASSILPVRETPAAVALVHKALEQFVTRDPGHSGASDFAFHCPRPVETLRELPVDGKFTCASLYLS